MTNRPNSAVPARFGVLGLALAALVCGCSEPLPRPLDRAGALDTIAFPDSLNVDVDQLTRLATRLYARDLRRGEGDAITKAEMLRAHMKGWLSSGELFLDTRAAGAPEEFTYGFGELIRGLDLGLEGMRVGGIRQVIVPPSMGYGIYGTDDVPPYATLVFEIELVERVE